MCKINYVTGNVVALAGLLTGAAIVHNVYKPDLVRSHVASLPLIIQIRLETATVLSGSKGRAAPIRKDVRARVLM